MQWDDMLGQNAGKEQTAAVLGVQTCRSNVRPRPWQRLLPQNIAVQVWLFWPASIPLAKALLKTDMESKESGPS